MPTVAQLARTLQTIFTITAQTAARDSGFIQRQYKLTGPAFVQGLVFGWLALCAWDICVTNIPQDLLNAEESRVLLRARWQVEVLFERWKSDGQIDEWRSAQPFRILCEFYAKLLGQVVVHWCSVVSAWHLLDRSLWQVGRVVHDYATEMVHSLASHRRLCRILRAIQATCAVGCRVNRRTTRPSHHQLLQEPPRAALS